MEVYVKAVRLTRGILEGMWLILAAFSSAVWLVWSTEWFRGIKRIPLLKDVGKLYNPNYYPSLSVIVPVRNEEQVVEESLRSMLAQEYPGDLEVVTINDRSTDRTQQILERLGAKHPNLSVLHVEKLPKGWLGKNHALYLGAMKANGEWLLFTDADIRFSPGCFEYAVGYATLNGLHHLTLLPEYVARNILLKGFMAVFTLILVVTQRPWRARDPQAKEFVGIGAFNLLKRDTYLRIGTHRTLAMRPDDDWKLAKLVKKKGFNQGMAFGTSLLSVEWHKSLAGALRGLSKSMFPALDYRLDVTVFSALLLFLTNVLPFLGVILASGRVRMLFGANVLLILAIYACQAKRSGSRMPLWYAALHPLSTGFFMYALLRSAYTTLANDGIEWRGTRYPLELLRKNAV